jgi:fumarate hydratase class II
MGQSSNDVIPAAIHLGALLALTEQLQPALGHLAEEIGRRIADIGHIVKTGRTHLMDAVPLTFGQELSGWRMQVIHGQARLAAAAERLRALAIGGTAVGTGLNAHPELGARVTARLSQHLGVELRPSANYFEALSSQDAAVEMSGQLKTVAVSLLKIANDLRWMNSGPLAGLGEIRLRALQPGSSIMPGKVNPVIPEAVAMVAAQVIGNDATITIAGQSGQFQLNVMLPLIAYNLNQSIELLATATRHLADAAIAGFTVNEARINAVLDRSPMLVTALNPVIGYEQGAAIAKQAYAEDRPIREVAVEVTGRAAAELDALLDPEHLTRGGLVGGAE